MHNLFFLLLLLIVPLKKTLYRAIDCIKTEQNGFFPVARLEMLNWSMLTTRNIQYIDVKEC